ncbi:ankyrin repeat-containing domain protein [Mycena galopus ATCC 62051]|nr:ankyrin repeat-containing domain protein [Mycena galopus ATCC 62051]
MVYWIIPTKPLHIAVDYGNQETASLLLDAGANAAACCGFELYQPLHLATLREILPMISFLLNHGAPVNTLFGDDGCRETVLHHACWIGHV